MGRTHQKLSDERGATMVEIAFTFPLVLIGMLIFLWIGVFLSSSSSFEAALAQSMRLATRGDTPIVGKAIITAVDNWKASSGPFPGSLLVKDVPLSNAQNYLDTTTAGVFSPSTFQDLPETYLYTMVYIKESLEASIGTSVKFPCDPAGTGPDEGPGCVGCRFLNPITLDGTLWPTTDPIVPRQFVLECSYQPGNFILAPITGLLKVILGQAGEPRIILTRKHVFDWETPGRRLF